MPRQYFYYINQRGGLYHLFDLPAFLNGALPSGPSCIHEAKFLDFFFNRTRSRSNPIGLIDEPIDKEVLAAFEKSASPMETLTGFSKKFSYVSLCGNEINYLAVQDAPIVFHSMDFVGEESDSKALLSFAGSMKHRLDPSLLRVDDEGKLFHPVLTLPKLRKPETVRTATAVGKKHGDHVAPVWFPEERVAVDDAVYGLIGANVGFKLGFDFVADDLDADGNYVIQWEGKDYPIPPL